LKITKALINERDVLAMSLYLKRFHPRFCLLWELGIITGLRIGDLLKLKPNSFQSGTLTVTEQKTKKERTIKIHNDVIFDINFFAKMFHVKPDQYIFYSRADRKHKHMTRQWAHRIIHRTAQNNGLDFIGAHSMRKIYACNLFSSSGSVNAVQADLGHKHMSTTLIYLKDLLEGIK